MSAVANLLSYWAGNATLNAAIPATKVFLDFVPEKTAFPYVRLSVIASVPTYTTAQPHIETLTYQLSIFHTSLVTLAGLADIVIGQLDQMYLTAGTLINTRRNKLETGEVVNGTYTYCTVLEYDWSFMTSLA